MAQVTVIVNGRTYRLMCGTGEEARLTDLAEHIRQRIDDLSYEFGNAGDERLLLMAALMVTDELWDTQARLADVERRLAEIEGGPVAATTEPEQVEFEPEPKRQPKAEPAGEKPRAPVTEPVEPVAPAPAAPPAAPEPFLQEPSLKRALRRPQQGASKSAMEERLAEARNAAGASQRKTGAS